MDGVQVAGSLDDELARQVRRLVDAGYPSLAGLSADAFTRLVEPLRASLPAVASTSSVAPFLVVVTSALVPTAGAVEHLVVRGKAGFTDMEGELDAFRPIDGVVVPDAPVYLLVDVDTGADTLNVTPEDALPRIRAASRTPLTIDEGVALLMQRPDVFTTHNAFQALGSRATRAPLGRRVPSFWMSKGAPRLGWCWAGNPHTWLGAASAARRVG